jgi:hypothetical protein
MYERGKENLALGTKVPVGNGTLSPHAVLLLELVIQVKGDFPQHVHTVVIPAAESVGG